MVYSLLQSAGASWLVTQIVPYSDPSLSFIKGYLSINKQFSIDSFLDREARHWVSSHSIIPTQTLSTDHNNALATKHAFLLKNLFINLAFASEFSR